MSENKQLLKQAFLAIEQLKDRVRKAESKAQENNTEPIAIVGIGCRFPGGVTTPQEFWDLLAAGKNSITPIPEERWSIEEWYDEDPDAVGKMYARYGGFIKDVDKFDPGFFNISEQEALSLDPQERLMLETTWEALENAGQTKESLKDSNTGVYFGIAGGDYQINVFGDPEKIDAYSALGTAHSAMTGRISYWLGLKGPNFPVDTACSSSLVALHLGVQALRNGECTQALVGGVNLTLDPILTLYFCKLRALSPTGQCQTFSDHANGYVRSEGAGTIFLKPLSKAEADGDEILALIRGTAVNQDGKSQGFTAPNGPSQQAVIQKALDQAGITPDQVDYIECHGTGTPLGDPIEVQSIGSVLEVNRPKNRPVVIGSVKSNIGHTEGAAGIAGVIKTVLSLQNEQIPQSLHSEKLNTAIDWESLPVKVAQEKQAWKSNGKSRIAGVSSFGFSGTNAHIILEEAPLKEKATTSNEIVDTRPFLLPITAASKEAIPGQVDRLKKYIQENPTSELRDIAYTLATKKTHFSHKLGVVARSKEAFLTKEVDLEEEVNLKKKTAFLFTGGGAQYAGMGQKLYTQEPIFKAAIDLCAKVAEPFFKKDLKDILFSKEGSEEEQLLNRIDYMQPALFAFEYAMARLLESWGVMPHILIGHSLGEIVAASYAGVFSVEDGMKLISLRGKLMNSIKEEGMMASIQATEEEIIEAIGDHTSAVSVGVINSSDQIVVSGKKEAVELLCQQFEGRDKKVKRLQISTASHSPLMDAILEDYRKVVNSITFYPAKQTIISNVKGAIAGDEIQTAEYWIEHLRGTVRFSEGVKALEKLGVNTFIEVGPHPVLLGISGRVVSESEYCNWIATAHAENTEDQIVYEALAQWFRVGGKINWKAYYKRREGKYIQLPNYAFLRTRYWINKKTDHFEALGKAGDYPLSGYQISTPEGVNLHFILPLNKTTIREVYDHIIYEESVIPGAFYVGVFLAVMQRVLGTSQIELSDIEFLQALQLTATTQVLHILIKEEEILECYTERNGEWALHAKATANRNSVTKSDIASYENARNEIGTVVNVPDLFLKMEEDVTIRFEKLWQWVTEITANAEGTFARLEVPKASLVNKAPLHPGYIDNAFIAAMGKLLVSDSTELAHPFVPVSVGSVKLHQTVWEEELATQQIFKTAAADHFVSDIFLWNTEGELVAEFNDLLLRAAPKEVFTQFFKQKVNTSDYTYRLLWNEIAIEPSEVPTAKWKILQEGTTDLHIQQHLQQAGIQSESIGEFDLFTMAGSSDFYQIIVNWDALPSMEEDRLNEWVQQAISTLQLLDQPNIIKVIWMTKNAHRISDEEHSINLGHRSLWGIAKVARMEFPNMNLQVVDLASDKDLKALPKILADEGTNGEWLIRGEKIYIQQLEKEALDTNITEVDLKEKTVLITGGLGGLGLAAAKFLAKEKEVGHLVLLSRREAPEEIQLLFKDTDTRITTAKADVTDHNRLKEVIQDIPEAYPLGGIIHAAGILEDGLLHNITPEQIKKVVSPKALGAWNLHELTRDQDLDFFIMYSSLASVVGNIGQAVYAAANTYLDGLAQYRKQNSLPATSINWGPWSQIGMAASLNAVSQEALKQSGVHFIKEAEGVAVLGQIIANTLPQIVAVRFNTKQIARNTEGGEIPTLFQKIVSRPIVKESKQEKAEKSKFLKAFLAIAESERQAFLEDLIQQNLVKILGTEGASQITSETSLKEIGLDSLKAVELRNKLSKQCGVKLPVTVLFTTPYIDAIATYLKEQLEQLEQSKVEVEEKTFTSPIVAQYDEKSLSSMQERLWFMHKLNPESPEYNTYIELIYHREISLPMLHTAFYALIQRHEAFRMRISEIDGKPALELAGAYFPTIEQIDLSSFSGEEKENQLAIVRKKVQHHSYDFSKPPMIIHLVKWADENYKLLIGQHHIFTDGYSILFLIKELITVYESFKKGEGISLAPLEASYFDFVRLEKQAVGTPDFQTSLIYWKEKLNQLPVLNLPVKKGVEDLGFLGEMVHFEINEQQTAALEKIAAKEGITLNAVVFGIYAILLRCYTNQDDFGIGTAVANRTEAEYEIVQGFFVNTLVWRCQFEQNQSLSAHFQAVNKTINESLQHQETPYQHIVENIEVEVGTGQTRNLYNASFTFQGFSAKNLFDEDSLWEPELRMLDASVEGVTKNDLSMTMAFYEGRLLGNLSFRPGLFERAFIDEFVDRFDKLINNVIEKPEIQIDELSILDIAEQEKLLEWSGKNVKGTFNPLPIIRQFEAQVKANPDAIALTFGDREISYAILDQQANQLAHYLKDTFLLKEDDVVGILLERSPEAIISMLGILKAGAAFLPIDVPQPNDRIQYILENAQIKAVILESHQLFDSQFSTSNLFAIDVQLADLPVTNQAPDLTIASTSLAYVIYTSGSTGKPKGVGVEHRNIAHYISWANQHYFNNDANYSFGLFTSLAFDLTLTSIFTTLLRGGQLHIFKPEIAINDVLKTVFSTESAINSAKLTPSHVSMLKGMNIRGTNVEKAILGGEKLQGEQVAILQELNPNIQIFNEYGPTETTVGCMIHRTNSPEDLSIGKAIPGYEIYILTSDLKLQAAGIWGEICVGGKGVARGYIHNPEMTAERFIENPFSPGERIYKTGDIARWTKDGTLEYSGRVDNQVKINGYRIELGEVEAALATCNGVGQSIILAKDVQGSTALCAWYQAEENISTNYVQQELQKTLPAYMVPTYFIRLDRFELTKNGKIDTRQLPDPITALDLTEYRAPQNEIEKQLTDIWAELLAVPAQSISTQQSFFVLGGNSLKAVYLLNQIQQAFQVELSLQTIFDKLTIHHIALEIEHSEKSSYEAITPAETAAYYPLSSAQKRLYFLYEFDKTSLAYNMPMTMEWKGALSLNRLEQAFRNVIVRHEGLRTHFELIDGNPVQVIGSREVAQNFRVAQLELLDTIPDTINAFVRPFNLEKGELLRVGVVPMEDNKHLLLIDMHHIITDGISLNVLIRDFSAWYQGVALEAPKLHYKDYVVWNAQQSQEEEANRQKQFWKEQLGGDLPIVELPYDYPRPAIMNNDGAVEHFRIDGDTLNKLNELATSEGASLFTVLMAAFNILLSRLSGSEDILVGSPVAGRRHADLAEIVGLFINTLVFRNQPSSDLTGSEFIRQVKENSIQALDHQDFLYEDLIEELNIQRNTSRNPLFDVLFVLQNMGQEKIELPGVQLTPYPISATQAKFDLTLMIFEKEDGLEAHWEYATALFKPETIQRFSGYFCQIIDSILANKELPLRELPLLPASEYERLIHEFNQTTKDFDRSLLVHQQIEKQVIKTPKRIAIRQGNETLTYQQLNEQANQLAHHLIELGVSTNMMVGVCLEKSPAVAVATLAILKAGGAYLPLDSEYPTERLNYMLQDAEASILITINELASIFTEMDCQVIDLDQFEGNTKSTNPDLAVAPDHLIYSIYTSGSTGQPKGSLVYHKGFLNLMHWYLEEFGFDTHNNFLLISSTSFDLTQKNIFAPLMRGGTLCLPESKYYDPTLIRAQIEKDHITNINCTPSAFYLLTDDAETAEYQQLSSLEYVVLGGEPIHPKRIEHWSTNSSNKAKVVNSYGPTECSDVVAFHIIEDSKAPLVPVGKAIGNTQLYILDQHQNLLPFGMEGELYIGGVGVGAGYKGKPELTAEKFIDNPFASTGKIYGTGDLVKWIDDGKGGADIEFVGRIDHQVKIRGYRIELGEIDAQLSKHSEINESLVVALDDEGTKYLCGYYTAAQEIPEPQLRNTLMANLPAYMVPSYFVYLEEFPLTPNGKIDRHSLPEPNKQQTLKSEVVYEAPVSDAEKVLITVMESVLAKSPIGLKDHFFAIGGDSIKSIQIVSKLKAEGYQIAVKDIFQHPVMGEMAVYLTSAGQLVDQSAVEGKVVLSPIQNWFFDTTSIDAHHFNQSIFLKSEKTIDGKLLEGALLRIMEHHDQLRARFLTTEAGIEQIISPTVTEVGLIEKDFKSVENPESSISLEAAALQESLSLSEGPLFKAGLFHTNDGDHLLLVAHHLVIDGVSWRIILEDLLSLLQNPKAELPFKSHAFQYWSQYLKAYAQSPAVLQEETYWTEISETINDLGALPQDANSADNLMKDTLKLSTELAPTTTENLLGKVHQAYRTDINDILLTGLAKAVKTTFNQSKIGIRLEGHGREDIGSGMDVSRTVGWFTNIYPVVLNVEAEEIGQQLIENKEHLHRIPNKGMGFGALNKNVEAPILFNYLGQFDMASDVPGMQLSTLDGGKVMSPERRRDCQLEVIAAVKDGQMTIHIEYNKKQYDAETINKLLLAYKTALEAIEAHCLSIESSQYTPSDFIYKDLTQTQLNAILNRYDVTQIANLTPMQEGMLFHSLSGEDSETYFQQFGYRVQWKLNTSLVDDCLAQLANHHEMLRTAFLMEGVDVPLQVTLKQRIIPNQQIDLSALSATEQDQQIKDWKAKDVKHSFDMANDALIRFTIFSLGNDVYEIVWSYHHILMDGWCLSLVMSDFKSIYEALNAGQEVNLSPAISFGEYIQWLNRQNQQASLQYWKDKLDGYDKVAVLPTKKDVVKGYQRKEFKFNIPSDLVTQMNQIAAANHVTPGTIVQALWSITLAKYNHTDDVVFGAVTSGRQADVAGIDTILGLFINTVPIRCQFNEEDTFITLIQQLQEQVLDAQQHDYCSLASIQSLTDLKHNLLSHIMVFENFPVGEQLTALFRGDNEGEQLLSIEGAEQTNYDFNIMVVPGAAYELNFSYNSNVYHPETVSNIATHFLNVIEQAISNPSDKINDLQLLSTSAFQELITQNNQTQRDFDTTLSLVDLFEQQVAKTPEALALAVNGEHYSYATLNKKANQLAHHLISKGVSPQELVGLMSHRSVELIIGMLAIVKAGATYVPIDPKFPDNRIQYMLQHSGMRLLLTDNAAIDSIETILITDEAVYTDKTENIEIAIDANAAVYMIYTSGSTGVPKGIEIPHQAVHNFILGITDNIPIEAQDSVLSVTTISFDIFVLESWLPLCMGASMVLANETEIEDANALSSLIVKEQATWMQTTPSRYQYLIDVNAMDLAWQQLQKVLVGGEAFPKELLGRLQEKTTAKIFNMYGPTETTVWSAMRELTHRTEITIGHPIANTQLLILDSWGKPVPQGLVGELYIAGKGLAIGYFDNATLTNTVFIDNPYVNESDKAAGENTQIYKTGDLARLNEAGEYECLGRVDDQVKIHGYRIELGELETVVNSLPGVKQSAAIASGSHTEKQLIVYYVADHTDAAFAVEIKEALARSLPQYMVPSVIARLGELPQTPNGKTDKKALLALEVSYKTTSEYVAPKTAIEKQLVSIWQELLEIEKIGIEDNFFDLGGHSLKAMYLLNHIQTTLKVRLQIKTIFEHPTIETLADFIENNASASSTELIIPVADTQEYYPLSTAQMRLYFLYEFDKQSVAYNMPLVLEIEGRPDVDRLENAIQEVINRQAILRTNFRIQDGNPVQIVHPHSNFKLAVEEIDEETLAAKVQDFVRPFDLANDPLIRVVLVKVTDDQHYILLDVHHIIADGTTHSIIVKEFMAIYEGTKLPALNIQYKDYAVWQNTEAYQNVLQRQGAFWQDLYADEIPVLELPTDRVRPAVQQFDGDRIHFELSTAETTAINQLAREQELSQFMVLFGAYAILLSKLSGQEDIIIGSPVAGRNHTDLANIAGMFVNTLALRSQPKATDTLHSYLSQLKTDTLAAFDRQDYPFETLVDAIDLPKDTSRNPLFNVMFVLQNMQRNEVAIEGLTFKPYPLNEGISKFDLTLTAQDKNGQLFFDFEYATQLFDRETIERFALYFKNILSTITANPTIELGDISMLIPSDEKQIAAFNHTPLAYDEDCTVHTLFERQVELRKDKPAIYFEGKELTYSALNAEVNQLAEYLVSKGVKTGDNVAILMDRSIEFVISVLAIIKSGAAFLPINPRTPAERTNYMLKDSEVQLLLSQHIEEIPYEVEVIDFKDRKDWAEFDPANPNIPKDPNTSIAILYTSGTTGNPKGVQLPHKTFVNLIAFMKDMANIDCQDKKVLQFAELSFDATYQEMFACFITGGELIVLEESKKKDPEELVAILNEHQINLLILPTGFFKSITASNLYLDRFPDSLTDIIVAGEALKVSEPLKAYITRSNATLHNHYGPTETHVVTALAMNGEEPIATNPTIGTPISNTEILILDPRNRKQPIGVPGELCIAGDSLAMGYLNRPDLTNKKFVPHPFKTGERMYRTGDIASWNTDGTIKFIGRADHQVKIRGFRIELAEIEASLMKIEGIVEVSVQALGESGSKYLCAYYICDGPIDEQAIRTSLHQELPEYMVPQYFMALEKFPITKNGKLDRAKMPKPSLRKDSETYQAPRTEIEKQLVAIWSELLGIENIGIQDNFFDLGGHSLLAIKLVDQIKTKMECEVSVAVLFKYPVIVSLAAEIERGNAEYKPVIALQQNGAGPTLFCVPPAAGTPFNFYDLANAITDRPVYAFHASGLEEGQEVHRTIQEIAAFYIEAMLKVQPQGPYLLTGWSLGGIIAFEMAKQLEAKGEKVAQLILLDTNTLIKGKHWTDREMEMYLVEQQIMLAPIAESLKVATWKDVQKNESLLKGETEWLTYLMDKFKDFDIEFGGDLDTLKRFLAVWKTQNRAGAHYELTTFEGSVSLVKAKDVEGSGAATSESNAYGWEQYIPEGIDIYSTSGNHITMLKAPFAEELGEIIMKKLAYTTSIKLK